MALQFLTLVHPAAYLSDILTDPTNNAPRLRYAAWLEERGEPLGEFIQVQCRLADADDSGLVWEWERREQELLADFEEEWAGEIRDLVEWWTFRRGFIEEVSISAERFLQHARTLFDNAPILEVHLHKSREHLEMLCQCHWLLRLRHLDLSNNFIRDQGVKLLAQSPFLAELHSLNLSSAALGDGAVQALAASPFLRNLRELYLCDNRIGPAGIQALTQTPLARRLDVLHLRFNEIDPASAALLRRAFGDRVVW